MIDLSLDIHIKLVRGQHQGDQNERQPRTIIQFKNIAFIHAFYKQRGLEADKHMRTNGLTIRLLRRALQQEIQRIQTNGQPADLALQQTLTTAYEALVQAIAILKKDDDLFVVNPTNICM